MHNLTVQCNFPLFKCIDFVFLALGDIYCGEIFEKVAQNGSTKVAPLGTGGSVDSCLVFDEDVFKNGQGSITSEIKAFCGVSQLLITIVPLICRSSHICLVLYSYYLILCIASQCRLLHQGPS